MARKFMYNGKELADVPGLSTEEIREFYTKDHPELTNATVTGPEHVSGDEVFKFTRAVGTKG